MIEFFIILFPALQALLGLLINKRHFVQWNLPLALIYLLGLLLLTPQAPNQYQPLTSINNNNIFFLLQHTFILDTTNHLFILLVATVMCFIALWHWDKSKQTNYSLLYVSCSALVGMFLANNAIVFYVFWEISVLPIFLALLQTAQPHSKTIALRFFFYTFASSLVMLCGFIYLYWQQSYSGWQGFHITAMMQSVAFSELSLASLSWLFFCMLLAVLVKVPLAPFHSWQPETYSLANLPVVQFIAAVLGKMGIFVFLQWFVVIFKPIWSEDLKTILVGIATASIVFGYIMAWKEKHLRRLLAYYSMAHTALIVLGIAIVEKNAFVGSLMQVLVHAVLAVALFAIAEKLVAHRRATNQEEKWLLGDENLRQHAPSLFIYLLLLGMASIALPLSATFAGEFLILLGFAKQFPTLTLIVLLTTTMSVVVILRLIRKTMSGTNIIPYTSNLRLSWNEHAFFIIAIAVLFLFGIFPKIITEPIAKMWQL